MRARELSSLECVNWIVLLTDDVALCGGLEPEHICAEPDKAGQTWMISQLQFAMRTSNKAV